MTENEKALVRFDPAAAVANRALLSALAARSGYSLAEVRDAVTCYRDMRDRINCLIEYRESGRPMPNMEDMESKTQAIEMIRAQRRKGGRARACLRGGGAHRIHCSACARGVHACLHACVLGRPGGPLGRAAVAVPSAWGSAPTPSASRANAPLGPTPCRQATWTLCWRAATAPTAP
jgi:hypothetical protein